MQIVIHRGAHQIGGVATEIRTATTRILIDMGDELGVEDNFTPMPLSVPGVTDTHGNCDAVLFTHNHGDHVGQLKNIRDEIPLYMGSFAKDVLLVTTPKTDTALKSRIELAKTFIPGECFQIGDMFITPFSIDHSACDSYMFLIEADGKRILHTGDFRLHGFRGKAIPKILDKLIGKVDALIIEGTTLSRTDETPVTELELQKRAKEYIEQYEEALRMSGEEKEGVHIITMHACKGLEYPIVFLPDCNEGKVPHKKAASQEEIEEERRMFYVAMTRAKSRLEILYIEDETKKHLQPTRFLKKKGTVSN